MKKELYIMTSEIGLRADLNCDSVVNKSMKESVR